MTNHPQIADTVARLNHRRLRTILERELPDNQPARALLEILRMTIMRLEAHTDSLQEAPTHDSVPE